MRYFFFAFLMASTVHASEMKLGVFPGFGYSGQNVGVFRADTSLLFGAGFLGMDFFSAGLYGGYHNFAPQATDTSYGLAFHFGRDIYFELQAGIFSRSFEQQGTSKLTGGGYSGNLILGFSLNSWLGIDVVLSGKRISNGSLDKRTILDLLPMIAFRAEFE